MARTRLTAILVFVTAGMWTVGQQPLAAEGGQRCGDLVFVMSLTPACTPAARNCDCEGWFTACTSYCYQSDCPTSVTVVVPGGKIRQWGTTYTLNCASFQFRTGSCPGSAGSLCYPVSGCPDQGTCNPPFGLWWDCQGGVYNNAFLMCMGY